MATYACNVLSAAASGSVEDLQRRVHVLTQLISGAKGTNILRRLAALEQQMAIILPARELTGQGAEVGVQSVTLELERAAANIDTYVTQASQARDQCAQYNADICSLMEKGNKLEGRVNALFGTIASRFKQATQAKMEVEKTVQQFERARQADTQHRHAEDIEHQGAIEASRALLKEAQDYAEAGGQVQQGAHVRLDRVERSLNKVWETIQAQSHTHIRGRQENAKPLMQVEDFARAWATGIMEKGNKPAAQGILHAVATVRARSASAVVVDRSNRQTACGDTSMVVAPAATNTSCSIGHSYDTAEEIEPVHSKATQSGTPAASE